MTQTYYERWLATPQLALTHLLKDLEQQPPFDGGLLEDAFIEATGYSTEGKEKLTINREVATWAYLSDNEELFTEALAWHFSYYHNFLLPLYRCDINTRDVQFDKATLHLSRSQNKLVTILQVDWSLAHGREYEIKFYEPDDLDLEMVIGEFITEVEDYAAYTGGCKLITKGMKKYDSVGRIAGHVSYDSYVKTIKSKKTHYILT